MFDKVLIREAGVPSNQRAVMALKIYNSLTGKKELFQPITPGKIKMYVCGVTVYDYCHVGHARSYLIFDMVVRYLRALNYQVTYVRNITDIDDKIIKRAQQNGECPAVLAQRFIDAFHEDETVLGILKPDAEPRATQYVDEIIALVQRLLDKKQAYLADNGDVCFDVRRFKDYGKLSQRKIDDLISGARVEVTNDKRDPLDFVLWKLAKPDEPHWPSPWGEGRPGWHIECSAMATEMLGQPFDIHGGGLDLKFPHHENEVAQSEAAHGTTFANCWMHAGLLQVDSQKMSKSLGNFFTIRDVLQQYSPEQLRFFMLSSHYRSPLNYTESGLTQACQSLTGLYMALRGLPAASPSDTDPFRARFAAAMEDDFNTPEAFAVMFELAHEINRLKDRRATDEAAVLGANLSAMAAVLGLLQQDPEFFLRGEGDSVEIEALIAARQQARTNKDWQKADAIRQQLATMGVVVEDVAGKTIWRKR